MNSPHLESLGESASCQASFSCLATDMFLTATPKDTTSRTLLHLVFPHTCPSNHCRTGQKVSASIPIMQFPCLGLVEADNPQAHSKRFSSLVSSTVSMVISLGLCRGQPHRVTNRVSKLSPKLGGGPVGLYNTLQPKLPCIHHQQVTVANSPPKGQCADSPLHRLLHPWFWQLVLIVSLNCPGDVSVLL